METHPSTSLLHNFAILMDFEYTPVAKLLAPCIWVSFHPNGDFKLIALLQANRVTVKDSFNCNVIINRILNSMPCDEKQITYTNQGEKFAIRS